ncbi:hypothetical protein KJ966_14925 [bacterium]|nr:hypothetical protein [bacterium]
MLLKGPAQQLADLMIKLSLKHYNKEWEFGLEFELWNEISGNQDLLSDAEVEKLKETSKWCGGWIYMSYSGGSETLEFIDLKDWKKKYREDKPF